MRILTDHIVENDAAGNQLQIEVQDAPGAGGACHQYAVSGPNATHLLVLFQNGPIRESGVNGVTQEALLAIVIDRLRSFQSGPFACRDNAIALTHFEEGLMWLQRRTRDRLRRAVEGTSQK